MYVAIVIKNKKNGEKWREMDRMEKQEQGLGKMERGTFTLC